MKALNVQPGDSLSFDGFCSDWCSSQCQCTVLHGLANRRCSSTTEDEIEVFSIETAAREGYAGQLLTPNILESLNPRNSCLRIFKHPERGALLTSARCFLVSERQKVYC